MASIYAKLKQASKALEVVEANKVHFAVQGCCHGDLDKIYAACRQHEQDTGTQIKFLICCGDFQSVRNDEDMRSMAVPEKFATMGDFHRYYGTTPEFVAPYLTIFIGGNHEASNFLWENYYGGYVAQNIYYLGHSGVITVCGLRIAGLSGIYKSRDFEKPYPLPPYAGDQSRMRDAYHTRRFEIAKLQLYKKPIDIVLTHDWPVGITKYGDEDQLLRYKPYFEDDIKHGVLGNPHTFPLMQNLKPRYWFAAHLHCYFDASVPHMSLNEKTGQLDMSRTTRFIALDKCVRDKKFIDYFTMEPAEAEKKEKATAGEGKTEGVDGDKENGELIHVDDEWIRIVKFSHPHRREGEHRRGNFYDDANPVIAAAAAVVGGQPAPKELDSAAEEATYAVSSGRSLAQLAGVAAAEHCIRVELPPKVQWAGGEAGTAATSAAPLNIPMPEVSVGEAAASAFDQDGDADGDDLMFIEDTAGS